MWVNFCDLLKLKIWWWIIVAESVNKLQSIKLDYQLSDNRQRNF